MNRRRPGRNSRGWPAPPPLFGVEEVPLLTAAEMRDWDRRAQETHGIPERVLMETAGRAAARLVHQLYPQGRVVAVIGRGNNGGDAVVLLRVLRAWGREVAAVPVQDDAIPGHLLHGWEIATAPAERAGTVFQGAAVIVDGILGTGARGAPREPQAKLIEAMNASGRPVVALDGPSGVDLTDGQTAGVAVQAQVTMTFGAPKRGLLLYPGRVHAGRIFAVEVGFPPLVPDQVSAAVITPRWARSRLPRVPGNAHKGTMGTVAVLAGQAGMAGAAVLVGMGAGRSGAGKVHFLSAAENRVILQTAMPEALFTGREGEGVQQTLDGAAAVVAGPAMGTDAAALALLRRALESGDAPLVLDADALTLVANHPELGDAVRRRSVLMTPHPGEMARLLGSTAKEIVADAFRHVREAADRFGCAVLLKGAPSTVAAPGEPTLANVAGHAGIATGGMGDTLAGIAGALLAQGSSPREAGALALYLSGAAAEIAGGERALLPRDVAEALGATFARLEHPDRSPFPDVLFDLPPAR